MTPRPSWRTNGARSFFREVARTRLGGRSLSKKTLGLKTPAVCSSGNRLSSKRPPLGGSRRSLAYKRPSFGLSDSARRPNGRRSRPLARYGFVRSREAIELHGLESFYGKSLNQPKVELPSIDLDGIQVELAPIGTQLGAEAGELEDVLVDIDRERKNAQTTRKAKNDAIAEFDRMYLWVGRALETYFNLAGMHELAARVRPSIKRPGRRDVEESSEQGSGEAQGKEDTPPADGPASESS